MAGNSNTLAINGGTPVRTAPFPAWPIFGKEEEEAALSALRSGCWGIGGSEISRFERRFAEYMGSKHALCAVNGSVTLRIALIAAGIEAGDEVIIPPYSFIATAEAVIEANAVPVFVDIQSDTFNIDPTRIEQAITPRTRAIIPVHVAGLMADMDAIMEIAERHNLTVIEDAAHAHGSRHTRGPAGSIGHMGSFSFQSSKNLTCGEGGAILTNDDDLYSACYHVQDCGRVLGGKWYQHEFLGSNYRLGNLQAAILNTQLDRLEEQSNLRDSNGRYLAGLLSNVEGIEPQAIPPFATRHGYHLFAMRYDESTWGLSRADFCLAISAEGIEVTPGYNEPMYRQPMIAEKRFGPYTGYRNTNPEIDFTSYSGRCPVAEELCHHSSVWITQSALLSTKKDMDDIVEAIDKVWRRRDTVQ